MTTAIALNIKTFLEDLKSADLVGFHSALKILACV